MPTLVGGTHPLHTFLGFNPDNHVVILTLRDPSDGRKMPPNGHDFVTAQCTRGVRKVRVFGPSTLYTALNTFDLYAPGQPCCVENLRHPMQA